MISLYEFYFTINSDFDRPERKGHGAKVPGNERARERMGRGANSERARERVGQGSNPPESYWPIRSGERFGPRAKRLGTKKINNKILMAIFIDLSHGHYPLMLFDMATPYFQSLHLLLYMKRVKKRQNL